MDMTDGPLVKMTATMGTAEATMQAGIKQLE